MKKRIGKHQILKQAFNLLINSKNNDLHVGYETHTCWSSRMDLHNLPLDSMPTFFTGVTLCGSCSKTLVIGHMQKQMCNNVQQLQIKSTSKKSQLLRLHDFCWIGAVQKYLKSIIFPQFVYDYLSDTTKNRQSMDDTVQERQTEHTTIVVINLFRRLFARYQDCFEDVHPRLKASPLKVSCMLHKVRENCSERHDSLFFPLTLIGSSIRDGVENKNRPVLQVNLQNHPVPMTSHNKKDLNKSGNSSKLNGGHLNKIYIKSQDSIKILTWSTLHQSSPHSSISPVMYLTKWSASAIGTLVVG